MSPTYSYKDEIGKIQYNMEARIRFKIFIVHLLTVLNVIT